MNFQGLQAKYRRLFQESVAWKLLRADNAPFILAFFSELFAEDIEVSFSKACVNLTSELQHCRETGIWETETTASAYLNQWIRAGWLREMNDMLTKTDACDIAIRFCQGIDQQSASTTASHLRIVQDSVRDFAVAINSNIDERLILLENKKAEIQREINDLNAGVVIELTENEKRERIREIYQLASVLTNDFRRVEDEIRILDQEIRVQMIENANKKGEVLLTVMEKEALLAETNAGGAFESFYQLLCDQNRTDEFSSQLRSILIKPITKHLGEQQHKFLSKLMRELIRESERVFQVRRRTAESLRSYIESGVALENRAINQLLIQLEKMAINFKNANIDIKSATELQLPVGAIKIFSPDSMRLRMPDEKLDTSDIEETINSREPSNTMLDCLDAVQIKQVAEKTKQYISHQGPMTIASIIKQLPITSGLEELVAYLRIAKATNATKLTEKETVEITDTQGILLKASIPKYLLSADQFPGNIDELTV